MYNKPRVIPVLSIIGDDLVKTDNFSNPRYLGDPVNAVKIFNGKYVDELIISDIRSSLEKTSINFSLLKDIASEAFMPLGYGGGIRTIEEAKSLFKIGYEKIVFSSNLFNNPQLIKQCVKYAGSQSVVASVDVKKSFGKYNVYIESGSKKVSSNLKEYIMKVIDLGVGEIILNSIDKEGQMNGYDLELIHLVTGLTNLPVVASGGAGSQKHFIEAIESGAHAVAAGSMFVFFGKKRAVLISYKDIDQELIKVD